MMIHPGRLVIERAIDQKRTHLLSEEESSLLISYAEQCFQLGERLQFANWIANRIQQLATADLIKQVIDIIDGYGKACEAEDRAVERARQFYKNEGGA